MPESATMPAELLTTRHRRTLVLTLSDPASRNALTPVIYAQAADALDAARDDPDLRAIVLTGAGGQFCSGGHLDQLAAVRGRPAVQAARIDGLHRWVAAMQTHPLPVIAAVEGAAAGAGCSLALACDLMVAARDARFVLAYGRIGLSPDGGAVRALMQRLPRAQALEWLWLAQQRGAEDLARSGLVNRLAAPGEALAGALELADALAQFAPTAIAAVKSLAQEAATAPLGEHLDRERDAFIACINHENGAEGLAAWRDRRPPSFV